jgi:hypothetical protein
MSGLVFNPSYNRQILRWERVKPALLVQSRVLQEKDAYHWRKQRPMLVGCVAQALSLTQYEFAYGANFKDEEGDIGARCCAEHEAEAFSLCKGCHHIVGLAITSFYQPDDITGRDIEGTLPPCIHCRKRWSNDIRENGSEALIKPHTQIVSQTFDRKKSVITAYAEYSVEWLLEEFGAS